jgi:hypothetical protein
VRRIVSISNKSGVIAIRFSVAVDGKSQSVVCDPANTEQQGAPQKREAGVNYQRALEILRPLAVENRLTAEQKTWISRLEARLKATTEKPAKGPNDQL